MSQPGSDQVSAERADDWDLTRRLLGGMGAHGGPDSNANALKGTQGAGNKSAY